MRNWSLKCLCAIVVDVSTHNLGRGELSGLPPVSSAASPCVLFGYLGFLAYAVCFGPLVTIHCSFMATFSTSLTVCHSD